MTAVEATQFDEVRLHAATLAFAMLRFEAGAAHLDSSFTPKGMLSVGTQCYVFTPSWEHVPLDNVPAYLARLPSPALIASTTTRGIASLMLLDELRGERQLWGRKCIGNQVAALERSVQQLGLADDSRVLLQFDDQAFSYNLSVLRAWSQSFGVQVGWSLRPYIDDDRAQARMMLFRSDGAVSWGDAWPTRRAKRDGKPPSTR